MARMMTRFEAEGFKGLPLVERWAKIEDTGLSFPEEAWEEIQSGRMSGFLIGEIATAPHKGKRCFILLPTGSRRGADCRFLVGKDEPLRAYNFRARLTPELHKVRFEFHVLGEELERLGSSEAADGDPMLVELLRDIANQPTYSRAVGEAELLYADIVTPGFSLYFNKAAREFNLQWGGVPVEKVRAVEIAADVHGAIELKVETIF